MNTYDLIVIGGGPSGIFSAINVAMANKQVLLIEKNNRIGKKLLVAGQGRCNLTNGAELKEFFHKYGDKGKFLKTSLYSFTPENLIQWFAKNGLPLELVPESNKYFPNTFKSTNVVELLERQCNKCNVQLVTSCEAKNISYVDNLFFVKTSCGDFVAKNLLISTGGKSYPGTGTTGDGYYFAKSLGHKVIEPQPCLTPVYVDNYAFTDLSGISFKSVEVTVFRENKIIDKNIGDLLLTHHNLSGPAIIDLSRSIRKKDTLKINFLKMPKEEFNKDIIAFINEKGRLPLKSFINKYDLPERFIRKFSALFNINFDKKSAELSKSEREALLKLCEYTFTVTKLGDFNIAMATNGGVDTTEINPKTMESKIVKSLYFTGEVLDIDGDTGGFNIQAAFSTGYLAAQNILKK